MIGTPSLLLELALPAFATFMLVTLAVHCVRKERTWKGAVGVLMVLGFALLVDTRFYLQVRNRQFLAGLSPEAVGSVRLDRSRATDPEQVRALVGSLNRCEWFSANHGGWGEERWLTLELQSGEKRHFRIAEYRRKPGVVIAFMRESPAGYFHDGYAFSPDLHEKLRAAGLPLEAAAEARR